MKVVSKRSLPGSRAFVVSIGVFDGIHRGHRYIIRKTVEAARARGSASLLITFWPHPQKILNLSFKGTLSTLKERTALIRGLGVDYLWVMKTTRSMLSLSGEAFMERIVRTARIKGVVAGEDFKCGSGGSWNVDNLRQFALARRIAVTIIRKKKTEKKVISSSRIRTLIQQARFDEVVFLMGRPYVYSSIPVTGRRLGRRLGFPTVNLRLNDMVLPASGVYAVQARVRRKLFYGAAYIGTRPTIATGSRTTFEVHLIGYNGTIGTCPVAVSFLKKIRGEKKFSSLCALKRAISNDIRSITTIYSISH